jgi:TP901 family phage tail tape measure protein
MSEVGTLYINVLANGSGVSSGLGAAEKRIATFSRSTQAVGRGMTRNLTLPILAIGAASAKLALDFDHAMAKIAALTGTSKAALMKYRASVLAMAPALGKSPKELADALYFIVSSGQKGAAALSILTASAKASAAGLGETKVIADAVTSAVNAYGIKNLSAARATDVLIASVREGKMASEDLAGALGRVIAPAEAMGVSFDEVGASLASLSRLGLKPEEGATALRGIFMSFLKPTKDATDQLKAFGLTADDVRKSIANQGLMATLMMLRGKIGSNKDELAKLIPNVRALNGFLALTGRNAGANSKIFDRLANSAGATGKAFKTMSEQEGFKLKQSLAELETVGIDLGEHVVPVLVTAAKDVAGLVKWFDKLSPSTKQTVVEFGLFVAVIGPLLSLIGRVVVGIGVLIKVYTALRTALFGAAAAQEVLNAAQGAGATAGVASGLKTVMQGGSRAVLLGGEGAAVSGAGTVAASTTGTTAVAATSAGTLFGTAAAVALAPVLGALIGSQIAKAVDRSGYNKTMQNFHATVTPGVDVRGSQFIAESRQAGQTKNAAASYAPIVQSLTTKWSVVGWEKAQKIRDAIEAIQALAKKGITLNFKDLDKQGPGALNKLRETMMSSLHITQQQATQILDTIAGHKLKFTWDKQTGKELAKTKAQVTSAGGKIVRDLLASGNKGGRNLAAGLRSGVGPVRTAAGALASASKPHPPDTYSLGAGIASRLAAGMNAGVGPVLQAALRLANASKVKATGPLPTSAVGRYVRSPMLTWVGENFKPEVILPLTDKPRMMQLMNEAGMFAPGFFDSATIGSASAPPAVTSTTAGTKAPSGGAQQGDYYDLRGSLFAQDFDAVIAQANRRGTAKIDRQTNRIRTRP